MPDCEVAITAPRADRSLRRLLGRAGHNLLVSASGQLGSRLLGMTTLIIVARHFDPAVFGEYNVLVTYYVIALVLGSFGIDRLIIRDLAVAGDDSRRRFGAFLTLRVASGVFSAIGLAAVGVVTQPQETTAVLLIASAMLPAAIAEPFAAGFQARQQFGPPARAGLLAAMAAFLVVIGAALFNAELQIFVAGVLASELVRASYLVVAARRQDWVTRTLRLDWALSRTGMRATLPYALLAVMGMLYFRIDIVMLDAMIGGAEVGQYSAAYRVLEAAAVIPGLVMAVLFPRFAILQQSDPLTTRQLYISSTRLMLVLGLGIGCAITLCAEPIVTIMYTDAYASAAPTLVWLMFALVLLFWHAPNATVLLSGLRLRSAVAWSFVTLGSNVALNAFLIPRYGANGAAAATAASELLSLVIFSSLVCGYLHMSGRNYFGRVFSTGSPRAELCLLLDRDFVPAGPAR